MAESYGIPSYNPHLEFATSTPRSYPTNNWTTIIMPGLAASGFEPYVLSYVFDSGYLVDDNIWTLTAPTITSITPADEEFTINFTDTNSYAGYEDPLYAVYANSTFKGYADSQSLGGTSRTMKLGGWINGLGYDIRLAAMRYKNNPYPDVDYSQSYFSTPVRSTGVWVLAQQDYWNKLGNELSDYGDDGQRFVINKAGLDIIKLPYNLFKNAGIFPTSTFLDVEDLRYLGQMNYKTGIFINDYLNMAPFDGSVDVKARIVNGSWDSIFPGGIDYSIKNANIKVGPMYADLKSMYGKNVKQMFDTISDLLPANYRYLDAAVESIVEGNLKQYFCEIKNYLEYSLKKDVIANYKDTALRSKGAMRRLVDIQLNSEDSLDSYYQTYTLPFKGNVYIETKMLLPSCTGSYFNYDIVNTGNSSLIKQGRAAGVILFSETQQPSYNFAILRQWTSYQDVYGE